MASFYDTPDPPACISYPDGAPTTMTAARWGTLSPAPHGGDSHTDHRVSLPSVGTRDFPSPLGHHAWPSIPSSIPRALCLPPHTEDPKEWRVAKRSSQRGTGPPLTSGTSPRLLSQPARHLPGSHVTWK